MKIYAGNLPVDCTLEELETLFTAYGEVALVEKVMDEVTGEARGFAFLQMPHAREGRAAISALNGKEFKGNNLSVSAVR
jgi:RNA recognition motif-containing protein